ncbi:MAG: hypothetical protein GY867_12620 [bacterium]|nr:hypothetical protein [bacterium]
MEKEKASIRITETDEGVRIDIAGKSLKDLGGCCVKVASECCSGKEAADCCPEEKKDGEK